MTAWTASTTSGWASVSSWATASGSRPGSVPAWAGRCTRARATAPASGRGVRLGVGVGVGTGFTVIVLAAVSLPGALSVCACCTPRPITARPPVSLPVSAFTEMRTGRAALRPLPAGRLAAVHVAPPATVADHPCGSGVASVVPFGGV